MEARNAAPCAPVALGDLLDNPYRNTAQAVKPAHLPVLGNADPRAGTISGMNTDLARPHPVGAALAAALTGWRGPAGGGNLPDIPATAKTQGRRKACPYD
jgi:hypothetical protein